MSLSLLRSGVIVGLVVVAIAFVRNWCCCSNCGSRDRMLFVCLWYRCCVFLFCVLVVVDVSAYPLLWMSLIACCYGYC